MNRATNPTILATFAALGCTSMIVQALMVREFLVVFHGNELCMGFILGMWLFSIAAGTTIYAVLSRRINLSPALFSFSLALFSFVPLVQLVLIRGARHFLSSEPGSLIPFIPMAGWTLLVVLPYGLLMGALFPMGCSLLQEEGRERDSISRIYAFESFGALAGGALFSSLLVTGFSPLFLLWCSSLVLALCALILVIQAGQGRKHKVLALLLVLVLLGAAPWLAQAEKKLVLMRWNSLVPGLPLLVSTDSPYENLALTRQGELFSLYGNGEYALSFPDPYQNKISASLLLSEHPAPRKILVIGLVSGGFLAECLKHEPSLLHYVLLDGAVMKLMTPCLGEYDSKGFHDRRVKVIHTDGRHMVNRAEEKYDLVILALPDPSTAMVNRFYTEEFFRSLARILEPGGVVTLSLMSSENYVGAVIGNYNSSVYRTLHAVFPYVAVSPGDRYIYFASPSPGVVSEEPAVLAKRIRQRNISEEDFPPALLEDFFETGRVEYAHRAVSKGDAAANSDSSPVTYYYNLLLWDRLSGSKLAAVLHFLKSLNPLHMGLFLAALFLLRAFWIWRFRPSGEAQERFNLQAAVLVFGFAAMGFEVMLIFSFQNLYGCLYKMIGILVASFMAGMTAGALIFSVLTRHRKPSYRFFAALQAALVVFSLLLPHLVRWFSSHLFAILSPAAGQCVFMALMFTAGLFNGFGFPCACRLYPGERTGHLAGVLNGCDHLGAGLGGLLCGTFLIPVTGSGFTSVFITLLALAASALWIFTGISAGRERAP